MFRAATFRRVFALGWVYDIPAALEDLRLADRGSGAHAGGRCRCRHAGHQQQFEPWLCRAAAQPHRQSQSSSTDRTVAKYFNTAAFTAAPQFVIGNSSRNPVRGPGLQNADLMIGKTFRITERINLEFRAEVFNVSNTPPLERSQRKLRKRGVRLDHQRRQSARLRIRRQSSFLSWQLTLQCEVVMYTRRCLVFGGFWLRALLPAQEAPPPFRSQAPSSSR